ncbi:MAG: MFS transporter [Propionibacteriaceae bacterium]|jgi:MFS family permease|nr:MFS transporter [Propionibacteriaceae bacterium]
MELLRSLRALLRHRAFRRLLGVRVATQLGDGLVQVGMLAYALFSPQHQPNGWAIVTVLAINYLPFSFIAPFVAPLLDRWPRQRSAICTDIVRTLLCAVVAWQVLDTSDSAAEPVAVYVLLLLVMSLNRFVLAGLAAGLADTVDENEYLHASSLMPVIGPITLVMAGIVAGVIRVVFDTALSTNTADAIIFGTAALTFAVSVALLARIGRYELGPTTQPVPLTSPADVPPLEAAHIPVEAAHTPVPPQPSPSFRQLLAHAWVGAMAALHHLKSRPIVVQGLSAVALERTGYGVLMTVTILAYRNTFHQADDLSDAIADMGVWFIASGVGFALSGVAAPIIAARLRVRNAMLAVLACSALVQALPGSVLVRPTLVIAALLNGVCVQSVKVYTDTLTQAHISDEYRGRVFMLYDIINNVALVLGALLAAIFAPTTGLSLPVYLGLAAFLLLGTAWFGHASAAYRADFDKGSPWVTKP